VATTLEILIRARDEASAAFGRVGASARAMSGQMMAAGASMQRAGATMSRAGRTMTRSVTLPIVAVGAASVKMAADFDQSMRNVNSIMRVSEADLAKYSDQVRAMTRQFPQDATTLSKSLYEIASSGFEGAAAMKVLRASAAAASAGMTDADTASSGITSVLNAYGRSAKDASQVSDVLFTGVDKGVMTFEELSKSIGTYIGAASQLAIPLEDVVGAQAAMTLTGINAFESATSLNAIMRTLLKPSAELSKVLKEQGFATGQAALEQEGLQGVMKFLAAEVGNNKSKWVQLFPEIRAARGAMALAANDGENLSRVMGEMGDSAGKTNKALQEQSKGAMFQFRLAMNRLKDAAIQLGNQLIPVLINDIIPAVQKVVRWWSNLSDEGKSTALKLGLLLALAGPLLRIAGVFTTMAGGALKLGGALAGLGKTGPAVAQTAGSLKLLGAAAAPLALVTMSVRDLAAALLGLRDDGAIGYIDEVLNGWSAQALGGPVVNGIGGIVEAIRGGGSDMEAFRAALLKIGRAAKAGEMNLSETEQAILAAAEAAGVELPEGARKMAQGFVRATEFMTAAQARAASRIGQSVSEMQAKVRAYTRDIKAVPEDWQTKVAAETSEAQTKVRGYTQDVKSIPNNWQTLVVAQTDTATARINAYRQAILSLPQNWQTSVVAHTSGTSARGATGGIVTRPTMALIGEAGPEAVIPLNRTPGSSPLPRMGGDRGMVKVQIDRRRFVAESDFEVTYGGV
jgi:TP901 family phage tail tape measure protein